jgi:IclR family transcriptional regulator, mhp operon transcriptional activator
MAEKAVSAVEPVMRALAVLEALNNRPVSRLAELARSTGLPKSTLVRLLDTLILGGYAHQISRRKGYSLAERVTRLSGGFRHSDAIVEVARPFLSALTAEHKWPVAIATLDRDAMMVRLSTRRESPFATDPDFINRRVPMLVSALGRAYLAFCPSDEREAILAMLRASKRAVDRPARDAGFVRNLVQSVRRQGFASTGPVPGDRARGLAIPVMSGPRTLAAMTLRFIDTALTEEEAARRYLVSLRQTAERIANSAGLGA